MIKLSKTDLFGIILDNLRKSGWFYLLLSSYPEHPLRLRIFRQREEYTVRIYIWNMTHGGGAARPVDEYRIQITGIDHFEPEPQGKTLILGWWGEAEVFSGFDFRKHAGHLGYSPSIQIREQYLRDAYEHGFAPCNKGNQELAIAFRPDFLIEYIRSLESLHDFGKQKPDFDILSSVASDPDSVNDSDIKKVTPKRQVVAASIRRALRDISFRNRVLTSYNFRCSVCGMQLDLVQAAHIIPVCAPNSTDETSNGLSLCALHHLAYDKALISIGEDYKILISSSSLQKLKDAKIDDGIGDFKLQLRKIILLPPAKGDRPNIHYLHIGREIRNWVD
jgi:putative restriction endonuclease